MSNQTHSAGSAGLPVGSEVVGAVFTDRDAAGNAVDELHYAGFSDDQVGMVVRDGDDWKVTGMGRNSDAEDAPSLSSNRQTNTEGRDNAGDVNAVPPAIIVPAPLTGVGTAGAPAGGSSVPPASTGVAGLFAAYGFDETVSGRLGGDLEKGALLIVVKAPDRSTEAKNILERNGGKMAR
jgi:hypothetical protein